MTYRETRVCIICIIVEPLVLVLAVRLASPIYVGLEVIELTGY